MWKCQRFSRKSSAQGGGIGCSSMIFIFLVTFQQLLKDTGVMGQVVCYQCVWQSSGNLPSAETVNDVCRPQNFQPETVHQDICLQGCITTILYEYDPENPTTTTVKPAQKKNGTSKPPMTFFFRGCPKNDIPRSKTGCEAKSYQNVHQEECFCTSNLCNGNHGSRSISPCWMWILMLTLLLVRNVDFHPSTMNTRSRRPSTKTAITSGMRESVRI